MNVGHASERCACVPGACFSACAAAFIARDRDLGPRDAARQRAGCAYDCSAWRAQKYTFRFCVEFAINSQRSWCVLSSRRGEVPQDWTHRQHAPLIGCAIRATAGLLCHRERVSDCAWKGGEASLDIRVRVVFVNLSRSFSGNFLHYACLLPPC